MTRLVDADKLVWSIPPEEHIARCIVANAPTVEAVPIEYMQSQVDCGKWTEIIRGGKNMSRLINADALYAEMYHKSFEVDDGRNVWNSGLWIRYKIFEEAIRDAPTIDAVPVVHGRWTRENNYGIWECSECGCRVNRVNPLKGNIWNYYYCPNCGARMDAERKEE